MQKIELKEWKLRGYFNCDPFFARSRETNALTRGVTFDMDITTPHDIYADLEKYGYIENPYFGLNSMKCEWVAARWWLYYTEITLDKLTEHMEIVCEGVDSNAHVLVNDTEIGYLDNSFITFTFNAAPYLHLGKNEIRIVVENAPNEYGQIGCTARFAATTLIDFYMTPKKAYYAVAKAFNPLNVSLKYDGYRLDKGSDFRAEVFVIWDHEPLETKVSVRAEANSIVLFENEYICTPEGGYALSLGEITCSVPDCSELKVTLCAKNSADEYENEIDFLVR